MVSSVLGLKRALTRVGIGYFDYLWVRGSMISTLTKLLPGQVVCNYGLPGTAEEITNWLVQDCIKFWEPTDELEDVCLAANNVIANIVTATGILESLPHPVSDGFFTVWRLLWTTDESVQPLLIAYMDEWIDDCSKRLT